MNPKANNNLFQATVQSRAGNKVIVEASKKKYIGIPLKKLKFFRKTLSGLVTGDNVLFQLVNCYEHPNQEGICGEGKIVEILPRKNCFLRANVIEGGPPQEIASNLDRILILSSVLPRLTPFGLIDRILVAAEFCQPIEIFLVWNKADLLQNRADFYQIPEIQVYQKILYNVFLISVKKKEIEPFNEILKYGRSLLIGASGVGKTSLINCLIPNLNLTTLPVSLLTGKGQHATTLAREFEYGVNGKIVDTPGVKMFPLKGIIEDATPYFIEFQRYLGACKFRDCQHQNDLGCAIKKAVEQGEIAAFRYKHYLEIQNQIKVERY
ncbi:MAG: ribosome small subunit-dependent GTPase A [bacterium]|nr:ribosome small subunit-dependent GTPase A [bacterium]